MPIAFEYSLKNLAGKKAGKFLTKRKNVVFIERSCKNNV